MNKTIGSGEVSYAKEDAEQLRAYLIGCRDEALKANNFFAAVTLSHAIAFMAVAIREIWE